MPADTGNAVGLRLDGVTSVAARLPDASCPLVSAIVPSYNHAAFVGEAVASVLAQDYPRIELIAIDDGSTDGSANILQALSEEHGFALIRQANQGVCKTLNRAIKEAATGDYIALLASDDIWRADKIRLQVQALASNPGAEFCFSQAMEFSASSPIGAGRPFPSRCYTGSVLDKVFVRQHVPAGTMMFSRELYDEIGGFDETLKEEDWDFVIRCAARTRFAAVSAPLLFYRSHPQNTMTTRSSRAIFQEKAKILAKNFDLVRSRTWVWAMALHFIHDIALGRLRFS